MGIHRLDFFPVYKEKEKEWEYIERKQEKLLTDFQWGRDRQFMFITSDYELQLNILQHRGDIKNFKHQMCVHLTVIC